MSQISTIALLLSRLCAPKWKCHKCHGIYLDEYIKVYWDDDTDVGTDLLCHSCFRNRYLCSRHKDKSLDKSYIRPSKCVKCPF